MQTSQDMRQLQAELTTLAHQVAKSLNIEIDGSVDSIKNVDDILGVMHDDYVRTNDIHGLHGVALNMAAYIVTVIEDHLVKGEWKRDSAEFGPESFPYTFGNQTIFPYQWCMKRIIDGPTESVLTKFQALVIEKVGQ